MSVHICHDCERKMRPQNVMREFKAPNREMVVLPVTVFVCPCCGNEVYEDKEVRKIERQLRKGGNCRE